MNKIIEINNETITAVAGGCYCYCYRAPISSVNPTIMIGEFASGEECRVICNSALNLYLGYSECKSELPTFWIPDQLSDKQLTIIAVLHKSYGWV